jgi:hypothetical protein
MPSPISRQPSTPPPPTLKVGDATISNEGGFRVVGENKQNNYVGNIVGFSGWGLTENTSLGRIDAENIIHRKVNGKDEYLKVTTSYKPIETTQTPINDWLKLDKAEQERRSLAYKVTQLTPVTKQVDGSFAKVTNQSSRVFVAREASWGVFGIGAKKAELIKDEATLKYVLGEEAMGKNTRIKTETGAVLTQAVNTTQKMAKQLNQDRDAALTDLALFAVGGKVLNKLTGKLKLSGKAVSTTIAKAEAKAVTKVVAEETTQQVAKRGSKYFRRATKRFNKNTSKNLFQQTQEFFGKLFKGKNIQETPIQKTNTPKYQRPTKRSRVVTNRVNQRTQKTFIQKTKEFFGNLLNKNTVQQAEAPKTNTPKYQRQTQKSRVVPKKVNQRTAKQIKAQQNPIQQFTNWVGQLNKPQKAPKA